LASGSRPDGGRGGGLGRFRTEHPGISRDLRATLTAYGGRRGTVLPMTVPLDTAPAARRRQIDAIRAIAPAQRLRIADAMSTEIRGLAEAGIRRRHPDASNQEVALLLAELLLGRNLAERAREANLATAR
jgi:hypothetical protein